MNSIDVEGIYAAFQKSFLTEKKEACCKQDLPGAKGKNQKGIAGLGSKEKGPDKADGFEKPQEEEDVKKKSVEKPRKMAKESINMRMRTNNLFDKLYEEVMDDESDALGLGDEGGFDDDLGLEDEGEGGDEVTLTLPRDLAQQLFDALEGMLGGGEDEGEGDEFGDEFGDGDEDGDDDFGSPFPEAVESQSAPDGVSKLTNKNNKVGNVPTSSGKGDGKYTDKVGDDGDLGTPGPGSQLKKGHGGKADHGNMKVKASRPGAPGSHAFGN